MADNVSLYPGSTGTPFTAASDDVGGTQYPRQKIALGADGVFDGDVSDTLPMPTKGTGAVHLTAAPTVTAGAYTTGMVVGGKISLTGASRVNSGSGMVQNAVVTVKTAITVPYDVLLFDTDPSNSTFTDNSALALNVADLPSLCGVIHCNDVVSLGTPQALVGANAAVPFKLSASNTTLYAVTVIRGSATFASTSAIGISLDILRD